MRIYIIAPLLLGLVLGLMAPITNTIQSTQQHPILGTMTITVRNENNTIVQFSQPINGPTVNFAKVMHLILHYAQGYYVVGMKDKTGVMRYCAIYNNYDYDATDVGDTSTRVVVVFGNASNPSYSYYRYSLESEIAMVGASDPVVSFNGTHFVISFSASYTPDTNVTITEVGVYNKLDCNGENYFLVIYDVLASPINVDAGSSITVTYNIVIKV